MQTETKPTYLTEAALRWLTLAAVERIHEAPAVEAVTGATALHQLLRGTTAEPEAHRLLNHLTQAQQAARAITPALEATPTVFP